MCCLGIADITRILTFSLVTNWFGYLLLAGILFSCGLPALPPGWKLGAMVTDSLAFRSYPALGECAGLGPMQERILREHEDLDRLGITVFAAQNSNGEIITGDSHHYAFNPPSEDDPAIDQKISEYLQAMLEIPRPEIAARWSAVYPAHSHHSELVQAHQLPRAGQVER